MAKRTYDIRIRNSVALSQNPDLCPKLNIARSTERDWIRDGVKDVVTLPLFDQSSDMLLADHAQGQDILPQDIADEDHPSGRIGH
jgi:hypothetical protein